MSLLLTIYETKASLFSSLFKKEQASDSIFHLRVPSPLHSSPLQMLPPPPQSCSRSQLQLSVPSHHLLKQPETPLLTKKLAETIKSAKPSILKQPKHRRTNPLIWFGAILCLLFSLLLIFLGIATLIIYLIIKPRNPLFDAPNATLNAVYFDTPEFFNGDFIFFANFTNPNRRIDVRLEFLEIALFFSDRLIANQAIPPFSLPREETRLGSVHFVSSLVYLPLNLGSELRKQIQINRVVYDVRGSFRVRASFGFIHYSYWLRSRCQLEMTGPPTGFLVARSCRTKR